MDVIDFEYILGKISDIILSKEKLGGTDPIQSDERLALSLRFLATGKTFPSLSFQFRISLNILYRQRLLQSYFHCTKNEVFH